MKTIVAGGRTITNQNLINSGVDSCGWLVSELVSGGARGVDRCGEVWADNNKVPKKIIEADWAKYGRGAGPIRNKEMALYADALIAFWDGKSRGTKNMINTAKAEGLEVKVFMVLNNGELDK